MGNTRSVSTWMGNMLVPQSRCLLDLPVELQLCILSMLDDVADLGRVARTCRALYNRTQDDYLWKMLGVRRWGEEILNRSMDQEKTRRPAVPPSWKAAFLHFLCVENLQRDHLRSGHPEYDIRCKIILAGQRGAGKSSLIVRHITDRWMGWDNGHMGEFHVKVVNTTRGIRVRHEIWDTCGQELFRAIGYSYYRGSSIALFVYDITDRSSFDDVRSWLKDVWTYANADAVLVLVGTKIDQEQHRVVSFDQGQELATQCGIPHFIETSAATGVHMTQLFTLATEAFLDSTSVRRVLEERRQKEQEKAAGKWLTRIFHGSWGKRRTTRDVLRRLG